jgi:hypothetical protein
LMWVSKFHCCKKNRLLHLQLHKQPFPLCHYCEISNFPNVASTSQTLWHDDANPHSTYQMQKNVAISSLGTSACEVAMTVCGWLSVHQPNTQRHRIFKSHTSRQIYHKACLGIVLKNNDMLME